MRSGGGNKRVFIRIEFEGAADAAACHVRVVQTTGGRANSARAAVVYVLEIIIVESEVFV
jgi:hypothetical protein